MKTILAILATLAIGCTDAPPSDPLDGKAWAIEFSTVPCAQGIKFEDSQFEQLILCELSDGRYGVQDWSGPYTVDGDRLTLHIERASCNWYAGQSDTVSWSINGLGELRLEDPTGILVLQPLPPPSPGTFAATYGCFEDSLFTPMPVHNL